MSAATPPAKKLTRIGAVLTALLGLRAESSPPYTRYAILLALADHRDPAGNPAPMTSRQISDTLREEEAESSSLSRLVHAGLITRHRTTTTTTFRITPEGEAEAARIVQGIPKPKAPPIVNAAKAIAAARQL